MTIRYLVTAAIRYLDGGLAGLTIRSGYSVIEPTLGAAAAMASSLQDSCDKSQPIKGTGTNVAYEIAGSIEIESISD